MEVAKRYNFKIINIQTENSGAFELNLIKPAKAIIKRGLLEATGRENGRRVVFSQMPSNKIMKI